MNSQTVDRTTLTLINEPPTPLTGKEAGEITLHSLQVGQKQNLIPVWAINTFVRFELKQRSIYKPQP